MLLGKSNELLHIGADGFNATLHGRYGVGLPLQSYTLSPDGTELLVCNAGRSTAVHSLQIAAKHEYLVWLQTYNPFRCICGSNIFHIFNDWFRFGYG